MNTYTNDEINEMLEKTKSLVTQYTTKDLSLIYDELGLLYNYSDDVILKESIMDVMSIIIEEIHERK